MFSNFLRIKNNLGLSFLAGLLFLSVLLPFVSSIVYAQTTCKVQVAFKITDTQGKQINSLANSNTRFILHAQYTPDSSYDCRVSSSFKHRFRAIFADGTFVYIGAEQSLNLQQGSKEVVLEWQTSGLKDFNTKQAIQNGGTLRLEAYLADRNGESVTKSSPITLQVKSDSTTPPGQQVVTTENTQYDQGKIGQAGSGAADAAANRGNISISGGLSNPLKYGNIGTLISGVIKFLLGLLAALSALFIVIGGVRMIGSAGNANQLTAGKKTLAWAVIGLVVSLLAYTIIAVVQGSI